MRPPLVQTASVTFASGRFGAEAGIYPSHIGFEALQSQLNWNYTRSWIGELSAWSAQLHVLNGWQLIGDNDQAKAIGTQVAYSASPISVTLNTFAGPELPTDDSDWRLFADLMKVDATARLSIALVTDAAMQQRPALDDAHGYAAGLNARYQLTETLALAARGEVFRDVDGSSSETEQTLAEGTGTVEYHPVDHLMLELEGRYDHSTESVFSGSRSPFTGQPPPKPEQVLVLLGAVATL